MLCPAQIPTPWVSLPLLVSGTHILPSCLHCPEARSDASGSWNLELEAHPFAALVTFIHKEENPAWEPFSYQSKKELCRAQKEFGHKSEYYKGLVKATFTSNMLIPSDLKDLFL